MTLIWYSSESRTFSHCRFCVIAICQQPRVRDTHARAVGDKEERAAAAHDHPGRNGADQPRVFDLGNDRLEVGHRELDASSLADLLFTGKEIYLDHAARLSARPTASISSGATSSTGTVSNTSSFTRSRCTGFARSIGTLSRAPSTSFSPGMRAPPPVV